MTAAISSRATRVRLYLPDYLHDRLNQEMQFIGADDGRVHLNKETVINSQGDLIRWAVSIYIDAIDGGDSEVELEKTECDRRPLRFYMNSEVRGRWGYAIKQRWATDNTDLAERALTRYFTKIDQRHQQDIEVFSMVTKMRPEELLTWIRGDVQIT